MNHRHREILSIFLMLAFFVFIVMDKSGFIERSVRPTTAAAAVTPSEPATVIEPTKSTDLVTISGRLIDHTSAPDEFGVVCYSQGNQTLSCVQAARQ